MARTTHRNAAHDDEAQEEGPLVLLDNVHRFGEVFEKGTPADELPEHAREAFETQGGLFGHQSDLA